MERPKNIDLSQERLTDEVWEAITGMLKEKYGAMPTGYSLDIKVEDIDWEDEDDLAEYKQEVQSVYDQYLMKTENRGISYGEIAYIEGLDKEGLDGLYNEATSELNRLRQIDNMED